MGALTPENATEHIDDSKINGATGPIFIEGAEPGDSLLVKILDIKPNSLGLARIFPKDGQLSHLISEPYAKFFDVFETHIEMNENVHLPLKPMLGVIGVAPEDGEIATMPAGRHGGNLDNNENAIGATIYLPVKHDGALLGIGDMHASMGDGEIGGTGIEIGGNVLIEVDLLKSKTTDFPVTETESSWITHGVANEDITEAMRLATLEAANLLVTQWGFSMEDAFIFLSVRGDLGIAQNVHPSKGTVIAKLRVPKLAACPTPFNPNR
jgi:amidase